MLQQIRDKITGWFAALFLGAIAVVFIFWGIQFESSVNVAAATVNGEKIPVEAVRRGWQNRQAELQQVPRDELPEELVKTEQQRLLEDFIRRELLLQRAASLGYRVSDRELVAALAAIESLQVDGQFSRDRYAALLRAQGRTEADFEAEFRRDLEINQLQNAVGVSAFALPGELNRRVQLMGETREVQMVVLPSASFAAGVTVTDEEIAARYEQRKADFQTPETVNLQYVQLTLQDVAAGVQVTEEGLRAFYDQVAAERYTSAERRQARHILIESGSDDAAAQRQGREARGRGEGRRGFCSPGRAELRRPGLEGAGWRSRLGDARELRRPVRGRAVRHGPGRDAGPGQDAVRLPRHQARGDRAGRAAPVRRGPRRARGGLPARPGADRRSTSARSSSPTRPSRP